MTETVILIGAARSGTKFLRDTLATHPSIGAVPYDVNYVWRYGNGAVPDDVLAATAASPKAIEFIRRTIPKLALPQGRPVILEKTVGNALRVDFVLRVFPDAKFIHLVRDGRAVVESAMRCWSDPPDMGSLRRKVFDLPLASAGHAFWFAVNLVQGYARGRRGGKAWGPKYRGIYSDADLMPLWEVCATQWLHSIAAEETLAELPADRVYTVKYEDFVKDTREVSALVDFLGLPQDPAMLKTFETRVDTTGMDKWRDALTSEDLTKIETLLGPTLRKMGYAC